jgi:hypothetical protein
MSFIYYKMLKAVAFAKRIDIVEVEDEEEDQEEKFVYLPYESSSLRIKNVPFAHCLPEILQLMKLWVSFLDNKIHDYDAFLELTPAQLAEDAMMRFLLLIYHFWKSPIFERLEYLIMKFLSGVVDNYQMPKVVYTGEIISLFQDVLKEFDKSLPHFISYLKKKCIEKKSNMKIVENLFKWKKRDVFKNIETTWKSLKEIYFDNEFVSDFFCTGLSSYHGVLVVIVSGIWEKNKPEDLVQVPHIDPSIAKILQNVRKILR